MSDLVFQGESAGTLDAKGRMTVPARQRDKIEALCGGELTVTKGHEGCLLLYPRPVWLEFRSKLIALPMSADRWRRIFLGSAVDVEMDSASRVQLSPELREWAGFKKDLMLVGNGKRMEIWDREKYKAAEDETRAEGMPDVVANMVA